MSSQIDKPTLAAINGMLAYYETAECHALEIDAIRGRDITEPQASLPPKQRKWHIVEIVLRYIDDLGNPARSTVKILLRTVTDTQVSPNEPEWVPCWIATKHTSDITWWPSFIDPDERYNNIDFDWKIEMEKANNDGN